MSDQPRFRLWKVFGAVLVVNLFSVIAGYFLVFLEEEESLGDFTRYVVRHQVPGVVFQTLFFYGTANSFYRLLIRRSTLSRYLLPLLLSVLAVEAFYLGLQYLVPLEEQKAGHSYGEDLFVHFLGAVFFTGISLALAYYGHLREEKRRRKVLEQQKLQLEMEKAQAHLNFLKAQINPHFLHNTLNFLYAKALPLSPELSEGILTLSEIMRYALGNGPGMGGKALLQQEVEHVRNVIKINQLRFDNRLQVRFEVEGVLNGARIVPLVLITLVENAFKHGELRDPEHPVQMKLVVGKEKICFRCGNRKKSGPKEPSTGIGLDNIQKRLDLAYGDRYQLHIIEEAQFYTTELIIPQHD